MPVRTMTSTAQWDAMPKAEQQAGGANISNVWTIDEDEYQQFLQWKATRAGEQTDVWKLATHAFPGSTLRHLSAGAW